MIEKQELHCHECNKYVQFELDLELNGNHVLKCPNCGHEHCRVVENGKITGDRWDSRNGDSTISFTVTNVTWSNQSTWTTYTNGTPYSNSGTTNVTYNITYNLNTSTATDSSRVFLYNSWVNKIS